jgi:hypothetical protein
MNHAVWSVPTVLYYSVSFLFIFPCYLFRYASFPALDFLLWLFYPPFPALDFLLWLFCPPFPALDFLLWQFCPPFPALEFLLWLFYPGSFVTCFPILYIRSSNVPGFYIPSCRLLYFLSLPFWLSWSFPRSLSWQSIPRSILIFHCLPSFPVWTLLYLFHPCCSFLGFLSSMSCHYGPPPPPWDLKFSKSSNMTNNIVFFKYFNVSINKRRVLC